MRNILLVLLIVTLQKGFAQTYPSLNMSLLSHIDPESDYTGYDGRRYSGCWGWFQADKHKEYAIVGTSSQTYFIDVTNPSVPVICDSVKARRVGCTWREIKNYQNYCYIVSDDSPPNSFQIVDMQYLPDSVHVVHDGTTYFERCHTIFVDNDKLYGGLVTPAGGSTINMRVYSLANPAAPALLATLSDFYPAYGTVHDMFVRNDTVYASCGNEGFHIFKFNESNNTFSQIGSYTNYIYPGFNHSSWQTDDRKTMVFADEVPAGLPAKVIDVSNFSNILLVDTINSHALATPHNPYIVGNDWCWISTYQDGIYLYDISTPANTTIHGYFDTHPQHGVNDNFSTSAYRGNWGAYPFLPSKIIIACDMQNGIFILDADNAYKTTVGVKEQRAVSASFSVYPNPLMDQLNIIVANQINKPLQITVTDVLGKTLISEAFQPNSVLYKTAFNVAGLSNGCYFVSIKGNNFQETQKVLIQN